MQLQNMLKFKMGWIQPPSRPSIMLSSRIRLARNLRDRPYPNLASGKDLEANLREVFETAKKIKFLSKSAYLPLRELDPLDRRFLMERHLISHQLADLPAGRGVIVGEKELVSIMVNEEDHLRIQVMGPGTSLSEIWREASRLEEELGERLPFAYDARWGHLTACPTNTGTGLRASYLVHLPALSQAEQINKILEGLTRLGMVVRGLYGEGTRVLGDFYQISNATSMGRREEEFIEVLERMAKSLVQYEKEAQQLLLSGTRRKKTEDGIFRSLGILRYARSISFEETMQHLSRLRLGLSLGLDLPMEWSTLNELLILAQPAHTQMIAGKELEASERDAARAGAQREMA